MILGVCKVFVWDRDEVGCVERSGGDMQNDVENGTIILMLFSKLSFS